MTYIDSLWMMAITFFTVGYGDYFPVTWTGRATVVITVIFGQLFSAIVIGLVNNSLQLTNQDVAVLDFLKNKEKYDLKRNYAAYVITYLFKIQQIKKNLQ